MLRSPATPWGLPALKTRHALQVSIGNDLLQCAILFMTIAQITGATAILEHPAKPEEPELPNIWRLPETVVLYGRPGVRLLRFHQCCAGAAWRKPTFFLTVGLPDLTLKDLKFGGQCPGHPGHKHEALIGRDVNGKFKTAPAKSYPGGLCKWMGDAIVKAAVRAHSQCSACPTPAATCAEQLPKDIRRLWQPVGEALTEVQPDFVGTRIDDMQWSPHA